MIKPLISIIIPVVRNDSFIQECVENIKKSNYNHYEILVIDEGLERSKQRNIGIKRAKGDYILILDSDMMLTKYVLINCIYKMELNSDCVGIYIPERIVTPGWFGRLRDWERQFYNGTLIDVVRFVRRNNCPLFDEELTGPEDTDWERRIEGRKLVCDYPVNHHDKSGLFKLLRKKAYYARSMDKYKAKHPKDKLLTFRYRCIQVFIENGKWKRLLVKPHYALGVFLLIIARGVIYLCVKKY